MPVFTIETTYRLPVKRQRSYEADTIEEACRLAVADEGWGDAEEDVDTSGETYVTGIWMGRDTAYQAAGEPIPSHHRETVQRKDDHFEVLLGLVKVLSGADGTIDRSFWKERAVAAAAKAEAILAGAGDPGNPTLSDSMDDAGAANVLTHVLLSFDEAEVRTRVGELIADRWAESTFPIDAFGVDVIRAACRSVTAVIVLTEERGLAVSKAALAAISSVERLLIQKEKEEGKGRRK